MNLESLYLRHFRNYREAQFRFDPGVNLIVGDNAQGKTNLLEAICYLGSGKSFRAQKTAEMVFFHADFAELSGEVFAQERQQSLRFLLFSGPRPRQMFRNGSRKKSLEEISGVLPTVLFCPEDLLVLKAGAAQRRRFGDSVLCQLRPNYDGALGEYNRILDQKSRILKDRVQNPALLDVLPEFNLRLCQVGALLISYRA
ncbi:MAG TPA: AAA family ATPase, partial [Candidatus Faecousia faecipullorum]|nr:AAA family ATPase [Candidatus Faecousia faecipullorum]